MFADDYTPMLSQDYTPKVNEQREVVGLLPGNQGYTLRPPTNRDIIAIEAIMRDAYGNTDSQLRIFAQLSGLKYETLIDLPAESMEVMSNALGLFPVFRNQKGG